MNRTSNNSMGESWSTSTLSTSASTSTLSRTMMMRNHRHRGSHRISFSLSVIAATVLLSVSIFTTPSSAFVVTTDMYSTTINRRHSSMSDKGQRHLGILIPTSSHNNHPHLPMATAAAAAAAAANIIRLNSSSSSNNNENADLLEKARLLREEASLMEDDLRAASATSTTATTSSILPVVAAVVNTQLEDSIWTVSYRFSSQPAPKDDNNNNNNNNKKGGEQPQKQMIFYSGKFNLRLTEDGYSEQIKIIAKSNNNNEDENNDNGNGNSNNDIEILKIWGWDRETSNEDNLDYLLFSMDVKFPNSDPDFSDQKERYYFQARIEQEQDSISASASASSAAIALKDGTITVKKDITEKTGGMWGLFNVAGILTEFRYCGDFVAKPCLAPPIKIN